jgi:hypothetical protein
VKASQRRRDCGLDAVAPDRPIHSLGGPKKVARGVEEPVIRIHRGRSSPDQSARRSFRVDGIDRLTGTVKPTLAYAGR